MFFPQDVFRFIATRYLVQCFSTVLACDPISNCTEACAPVISFFISMSDLKKLYEINFKGMLQLIYKNKSSSKSFPISLDMKANKVLAQRRPWSTD